MMKQIDKSKLVLVRNKDEFIAEQPLETKEIGYYKDSWNRFKKNKASLVAFIIICIILFFVAFGPLMKDYTLPDTNPTDARRIGYLTPKIPVLEQLGIFDGTKTISRGKRFLHHMYHSEFGEGIILSGMPEEIIEDPNHPDYANVNAITVKVDYYKYVNYISSYMPERYYGIIDDNIKNNTNLDPLGEVRRTVTQEVFDEYMAKNYIIDILAIRQNVDPSDPSIVYYQYEVRLNQFLVSLNQLPEDTYFWFGTTRNGFDLFTEIWVGARISLLMAVSVMIINSIIGLILGAIAGYYGGAFDLMFARLVEIISSIPFLSVLVLLTLRYGSAFWVIILAFVMQGWIGSYKTGS